MYLRAPTPPAQQQAATQRCPQRAPIPSRDVARDNGHHEGRKQHRAQRQRRVLRACRDADGRASRHGARSTLGAEIPQDEQRAAHHGRERLNVDILGGEIGEQEWREAHQACRQGCFIPPRPRFSAQTVESDGPQSQKGKTQKAHQQVGPEWQEEPRRHHLPVDREVIVVIHHGRAVESGQPAQLHVPRPEEQMVGQGVPAQRRHRQPAAGSQENRERCRAQEHRAARVDNRAEPSPQRLDLDGEVSVAPPEPVNEPGHRHTAQYDNGPIVERERRTVPG